MKIKNEEVPKKKIAKDYDVSAASLEIDFDAPAVPNAGNLLIVL